MEKCRILKLYKSDIIDYLTVKILSASKAMSIFFSSFDKQIADLSFLQILIQLNS